jgi:hypothetical protein
LKEKKKLKNAKNVIRFRASIIRILVKVCSQSVAFGEFFFSMCDGLGILVSKCGLLVKKPQVVGV